MSYKDLLRVLHDWPAPVMTMHLSSQPGAAAPAVRRLQSLAVTGERNQRLVSVFRETHSNWRAAANALPRLKECRPSRDALPTGRPVTFHSFRNSQAAFTLA